MNKEQLKRMQEGQGFIAALDQSGGSTPRALALYGIPEDSYEGEDAMFDLVHEMRTRIITSPSFTKEHILAAILFENTMDREIGGKATADYLWENKGIVPFLKTDKGLAAEENGVRLMKPMPGLDALLERAVQKNIFGTKMRSVILAANPQGIAEIVQQQFDVAKQIYGYGLVPIIEPEVDINIPDKAEAEDLLLAEIKKHMADVDKPVMFKLTIPTKANLYRELMNHEQVVRVVALSGGYSRAKSCELLAENAGLLASFSRAFTEGLSVKQSDEEFAETMLASIQEIYAASVK